MLITTDEETNRRAREGLKPDLIGWEQIRDACGLNTVKQAREWERRGMPVVSWGPTQVAAYSDRVRVWCTTQRTRAA